MFGCSYQRLFSSKLAIHSKDVVVGFAACSPPKIPTYTIHVWYIFTFIWLRFIVNVGTCTTHGHYGPRKFQHITSHQVAACATKMLSSKLSIAAFGDIHAVPQGIIYGLGCGFPLMERFWKLEDDVCLELGYFHILAYLM